jgi:hypothetical protein
MTALIYTIDDESQDYYGCLIFLYALYLIYIYI